MSPEGRPRALQSRGRHPNRRRRSLLRVLAAAATAVRAPGAPAQDPRASLALNAAREWLALADRGDAPASHAKAAAKFRQALDGERWKKTLGEVRATRGAVTQRTLVRTTFANAFRGLPEGDYALLLFRTAFANRVDSAESVTLEREADGAWRVVGYAIR
jgi:hypothetical protein